MAWRPDAPAKTRRQFDAYAAERRLNDDIEQHLKRAFVGSVVLGFMARRAWVLGKGRAGGVARRVGRRPA